MARARSRARGSRPLALLLVLLVTLTPAVAQEAAAPPPPPPAAAPSEDQASPFVLEEIGTSVDQLETIPLIGDTLEARTAPEAILERYRSDPDFQYKNPKAKGPSLGQRIWMWIVQKLLLPLLQGASSEGGRIILFVLAFLGLAWVITRLLRADGGTLFGKKDIAADGSSYGPLLDVDDIRDVDVGVLLDQALAEGRLRDAVRFRYVLALQRLAAADAIVWRRDTTNREYVAQARASGGEGLAAPFADITRAFDYVWYGERPVDQVRYARLEPLFTRLDGALASRPQASGAR